jgi:hypothetical protein
MARQVENEDQAEEREDTQTFTAMVKGKLKGLLAKCSRHKASMDEARAELGSIVNKAVEEDNCHKKAFSWIRTLHHMDPVKRNELLFHFDVYRDHMGWEQSDLLADRAREPAVQNTQAQMPSAAGM